MDVYEIMEILKKYSGRDFYKITCRMLEDNDNEFVLPDSDENIKKIKDICETIADTKNSKISSNQKYALREFVANNLAAYGDISDKDKVLSLFVDIKPSL